MFLNRKGNISLRIMKTLEIKMLANFIYKLVAFMYRCIYVHATGTSLAVQQLRLHASTTWESLTGELRSSKLYGAAEKKKNILLEA